MTVAKGQGAMYALVHEQANTLLAIRSMTEELIEALERSAKGDDGQLEIALSVLDRRRERIAALETLAKRLGFLAQSGYEPDAEERERIETERPTIAALDAGTRALAEQAERLLKSQQAALMEGLKSVKESQKSIEAYAPAPGGHEGAQLDMTR